ncbi:MAG: hypothetical protein IPK99_10215 [Flavobacteriales bacterium]|nr:hypothetical protein [Flavobacteriales bacterium]
MLQPLRRGLCTARRMVTTNLLELVHELERMSAVQVHDHLDTIELRIAKPGDVETIDDLVCDALFVDPIGRSEDPLYWLVQLYKRDSLRSASDMHVVGGTDRSLYVLEPAA